MTNFLIDYAKKNVEKLIDRALKELRYICCFTCIAKEFEEEKDWLQAKRTAVGQRIQVAKKRGEDVQADALFWEREVDKIIQEDSKTNKKCFFGLCPDCIWRYRRGKELANKIEKIKKFVDMDTGKELGIGLPAPLPDVERYSSRHYISFKSRTSKFNELLDALEDEKHYIVGLQGMGGTGKTTLAKEVGKKLKQSKIFTYIIDTTVSFSPNIKKIQDDIAGPLGLSFNDCSESDRQKKLWKRLTNGEKILLILDDVWEDINFEEIGIPYSDNHQGCRILVTTRNMVVCNKLGCSKTIKLELLSQEDAWEMFKQHAGLTEMSSKSLLDKGFKIANECQGLPIAIAVIASSLKGNQRQEEWDVALKSLQKHAPIHKNDDDDDDDDVNLVKIYERLKFSYDNMKDGKSKNLFLLCSVFPEDEEISTEMLIRLGIGAGLFRENYGNYEDARNQVVISKNKLLDSCLLLEVDDGNVKMHDLVRDAAQWIANKEIQTIKLYDKTQKAVVERENNIKYLLCEGKPKDVVSCKFASSKLLILIVKLDVVGDGGFNFDIINKVPNSFFENISGLRVFHLLNKDVYSTNVSLPSSIQSLKNIRSLLFNKVNLGDISILENLQSLETLDLDGCGINEFPDGMAKLPNLRSLKLRFCRIRRNNPFKVIEGCSSLEELCFIGGFNEHCREITFPKFQRFILTDFESPLLKDSDSPSKWVSLLFQENKHLLSKKQLKDCIQTVEVLRLRGIRWEWANIIPEIVPMDHGMNDLVKLELRHISQLKCLIDNKHGNSQITIVFSKLVELILEEMECLEELCNGPLSFDSLKSLESLFITDCNQLQRLFTCNLNLCNLKMLRIGRCPMLIYLFELTTSRNLVSLEDLKIIGCKHLEYIIMGERKEKKSRGEIIDDDDDDSKRSRELMFPQLQFLQIEHCHGLEFIFPFLSIQDLPALFRILISDCENLQYIFSHYVQLGFLNTMLLRNLPNLINIFPKFHPTTSSRDTSKPGKQLEPMKDSVCCLGKKYMHKSMRTANTTIPLVSEDQQQDLPWNTRSLLDGPKNSFFLKFLTLINIVRCEKLEIVFSTSILRGLPQLLILKIEECKELKHIIEDDLENDKSITFQSTNTYFPKLEVLVVVNCNKLKCVFQTSVCKKLPNLKALMIREAYELQEIFKTEGDDRILDIPNLEVVSFINLPNLCYSQGMHFQAVKYRLVQNCHNFSLTSASKSDDIHGIHDIFDIIGNVDVVTDTTDYHFFEELNIQLEPLIRHFTSNGKPSSEITQEFAVGVEAKAASESGSILTSLQPQVLMNEQSMDQQLLKQRLRQFLIGGKALAANSSTTSETKKEPHLQLPALEKWEPLQRFKFEQGVDQISDEDGSTPTNGVEISDEDGSTPTNGVEISDEDGSTPTNVNTLTSSTHSKSNTSSSPNLELLSSSFDPSQVLMNEQSMDQQRMRQLLIGGKALAANSSTTSETKEPHLQLPVLKKWEPLQPFKFKQGVEISDEDGITPNNVNTLTSPTHSKSNTSSSPNLELLSSSFDPSQKDGDCKIANTSLSISTTETNDEVSIIADTSLKVSSNIEEQFPKDDKITVSKTKPSPSITSPIASHFPSLSFKGDLNDIIEDLSSPLLVTRELEQLVSKKHLDYENLSLLTDFFVKHPSVLLKNNSLSNRYKGYAYSCLAELLKFLQTHSVLDVLGSNRSEFVELLQDVRKWGFDKDWLDGVEKRSLFLDVQVSQDTLQKLLDSKQQVVSKEVEVLRLKIAILSQCTEDLKHQLKSSEFVLESIIQQKTDLSAPIGY